MNLLSTQTPPITLHPLTPTPVPQHSIPNTLTSYYFVTARDAFLYAKKAMGKIIFFSLCLLNFTFLNSKPDNKYSGTKITRYF